MKKLVLSNKSKILIISIALAILIVLAVVLSIVCSRKTTIDFTIDGQVVESYEIYSGEEKIQFSYTSNNRSYLNKDVIWSISGEAHGSHISDNGEFTSGLISGQITVQVSVTNNKKTITNTIVVNVLPRGLESVVVKSMPKTEYQEGQRFDPEGLVLEGHFTNGTTSILSNWQVDNADKILYQKDTEVIVSYTENSVTKQVQVPIKVNPRQFQSLEITKLPSKLDYIEGDIFDSAGMIVTAEFEYLSEHITEYRISKTTPLELGDDSIVISYSYNNVVRTVEVPINVKKKTLQSISILKNPTKLAYIEGESFDCTGIELLAHYEFLTGEVSEFTYDNHNPLLPTDSKIKFRYIEDNIVKTVDVEIVVTPRTLQSIEVSKLPGTTAYVEGQTFDPNGLEITANYEYKSLIVKDILVDITTPLTMSTTQVQIGYTENGITKYTYIPISMTENILEYIVITNPAYKTEYSSGELLNTLGLVVSAYYTNGTIKAVTGWITDKVDALTVSDTLVTVTYIEEKENGRVLKTTSYPISVTERVYTTLSIAKEPNKINYVAGEYFDISGMEIVAGYNDDSTQIVSNYSLNINRALDVSDTQINVAYSENGIEKTVVVYITVSERILTGLEIVSNPSTIEYKVGETFKAEGMIVRAIYNGGTYNRIITNYSINKSSSPLSLADQNIILTYTEADVTKTVSVAIVVTARTLVSIELKSLPLKLNYDEGEYIDILGLAVMAKYSDAPAALVVGWTHDKPMALTLDDTVVIVSYSEGGITKETSFVISVDSVEFVDAEVQTVVNMIEYLPSIENLTINDEKSVVYVGNLYTSLSVAQKDKVSNIDKLNALLDKLIELKESEPEKEYNISYDISNGLVFSDIDFAEYPSIYKNSLGVIKLDPIVSEIASKRGYAFMGWIDENEQAVTCLENIDSDRVYYAVFELTSTVNVVFKDYADKTTKLLEFTGINRGLFSISSNQIVNAILDDTGLLALAYYVELADNSIQEITGDSFSTNYNATINVYVVVANTRTISISPQYDGEIKWIYEYTDDLGETKSVNRDDLSKSDYIVPISAVVTVYVSNPLVTDIKINDEKVGLVYPATTYTFELNEGEGILEITFDYYASQQASITFTGLNTVIFTYDMDKWNGKLADEDLSELRFVFDEDNPKYINRYIVNGKSFLYADIAEYTFVGDTTIEVQRFENSFSINFTYTGGNYRLEELTGKQSVSESLKSANTFIFNEIFNKLRVYSDLSRVHLISRDELLQRTLTENISLYIDNRMEFEIALYSCADDMLQSIKVPNAQENFSLLAVLPEPIRAGYIFNGWSLTENGERLSNLFLETIVANYNADITLYAIWDIDENYTPSIDVDYTGELFIGKWFTTYNGKLGIVAAELDLVADGTYHYLTNLNGELSVEISGTYGLNEGNIEIKTLTMYGDYQLLVPEDFTLNIEWVCDNMIIATAFLREGMRIDSYNHYLNKGNIRSVNYVGNDVIGTYTMSQTDVGINEKTEERTILTLNANGTAVFESITKVNDIEINRIIENVMFRIQSNGQIWIISNGVLGTVNFTQNLNEVFVKNGQDYSTIMNSEWVASNELSAELCELIVLSSNGYLTLKRENQESIVLFNIVADNLLSAVYLDDNGMNSLNIEITPSILYMSICDLNTGLSTLLIYNKVI